MASDQPNNSGSSGGADRHGGGETRRPDDPWKRIETEKPQRDAARKAWDAQHDPSPDYEYAIRALPEDYGKDRPPSRDLTEAQRAELAEVFGRPADELLALRDKDPRAGHNRDDHGRILDHDGNPRTEKTPEQVLRETEHQTSLYSIGADTSRDKAEPRDSPDLQESSDRPDETSPSSDTRTEQSLAERIEQLAADLRTGSLSPAEAADYLDQLRATYQASEHPLEPEPQPSGDPTSDEIATVPQRPVDPPDRKVMVVGIDELGRPDFDTARYEDASNLEQQDWIRRVRADHGDRGLDRPVLDDEPLPDGEELLELNDEGLFSQLRRPEFVEDYHDVWVDAGEKLGELFDRREPTYAGTISPERPIMTEYRPHIDAGDSITAVATAALIGLVMADRYGRAAATRLQEWRQARRGD